MSKSIHHTFKPHRVKGKEFIKMWNNGYKDGLQKDIAKHFGISIPTVYRIRTELDLPCLHSSEHIGRQRLLKKVKSMYLGGMSSEFIAQQFGYNHAGILMILHKLGIEMRPQYVTSPIFYKTRSGIPPRELLRKLKQMYREGYALSKIAKELRVDEGTVSTKLKAMGFEIKLIRPLVKSNSVCDWCSKPMEYVYQSKGIRKQRFCNTKCKNKAKDYRRMVRGDRYSDRINKLQNYLKDVWGKDFEEAKKRILKSSKTTDMTKKKESQMIRLFKKGYTKHRIAREMGTNVSNVHYHLNRMLRNKKFRIKYKSKLTNNWRHMGSTTDMSKIRETISRTQHHLHYKPEIRINVLQDFTVRMAV